MWKILDNKKLIIDKTEEKKLKNNYSFVGRKKIRLKKTTRKR